MQSNHIPLGHYKTRLRLKGTWLPVLVRVECSKDDEGRVADRPRTVLYVGGERHERPDPADWHHRLWPVDDAEYRRLSNIHTAETVAPSFSLATAPALF